MLGHKADYYNVCKFHDELLQLQGVLVGERVLSTRSASLAAVVALAAGGLCGACSGRSSSATSGSAPPPTGDFGTTAEAGVPVALPSDAAFAFASEGFALIEFLVEGRVSKCMADAGFDYAFDSSLDDVGSVRQRRYGVDRLIDAQTRGFSPLEPVDPEGGVRNTSPPGSAGQAYLLSLNGPPDSAVSITVSVGGDTVTHAVAGGCVGESFAAVFGTRQKYLDLLAAFSRVEEFGNESFRMLISSPLYSRVLREWTECLRSKGIQDVDDLFDLAAREYATLQDEVRAASDDLACKEQVDLFSRLYSSELAWQEAHIDEIAADLMTVNEGLRLLTSEID